MTQRASDLLAEVADRLSADATQSGMVAAEAITAIEPEVLKGYADGSGEELVTMSTNFLRALFRSLRPDSNLPWPEYYTQAREYARRYAEKGVPLEPLIEGLAVFRRTVAARANDEVGESPYAHEVLRQAHSRRGDDGQRMDSSLTLGDRDDPENEPLRRQRQRPGVRRRGRRPDRGRPRPGAPTHEGSAHRLPHRPGQPAGVRARDRPRRGISRPAQATPRPDDDRPRQPERHQRHLRAPRWR